MQLSPQHLVQLSLTAHVNLMMREEARGLEGHFMESLSLSNQGTKIRDFIDLR